MKLTFSHTFMAICAFSFMNYLFTSFFLFPWAYFIAFLLVVVQSLSHLQLFMTPWTADCQTSLSMGFSKQEYWSGLPFSSPGHLPDPEIKPKSPGSAGTLFTTKPPSWQRELALTEGGIEVMRDSKATQVLWAHHPDPRFQVPFYSTTLSSVLKPLQINGPLRGK